LLFCQEVQVALKGDAKLVEEKPIGVGLLAPIANKGIEAPREDALTTVTTNNHNILTIRDALAYLKEPI
jgi:hypothetical protein